MTTNRLSSYYVITLALMKKQLNRDEAMRLAKTAEKAVNDYMKAINSLHCLCLETAPGDPLYRHMEASAKLIYDKTGAHYKAGELLEALVRTISIIELCEAHTAGN